MHKTLFLIHFAGGNCFSYRFLEKHLKGLKFMVLELPGRGRRHREKLIYDFNDAAEDLYNQIIDSLDTEEFIIMGHSMGALLGLRVTAMLEHTGHKPSSLIVGGSCGPLERQTKHHLLSSKELRSYLEEMGGFSNEVLKNDDLFEYFYPILKADLCVAEVNNPRDFSSVNCAIHAIMGTDEKETLNINNWEQYTKGRFSKDLFNGGHFFIHQWPSEIARIITTIARNPKF
ncbi:Surfactin synthase thioesterase subunit [Pedobacter terrae]|uniref:Surfactin synthase thioesterase subunit n=1 Tax=Pedobacter terrae TaxID=405671 RepID=A0A1G8EEC4_9SPHI|nr:alpha/beta fold hydrolase [Pedobacter terrae]SDH68302.1 Surfactin synthase thioesterase subunit [Pedobacter terrae]